VTRAPAALAALATAAALGLVLAACGGEARDLFLVTRSGEVPGAHLTVRVTDDGRASCNGRALVEISSAQLITAREAERDLEKPSKAQLRLAPGPQPVFSYRVRTEDGGVAWSDDSPRQLPVLFKLAKLTRDVARGDCHLAR
jgi:hypothetical protein